ncbi:transmembrane channel-like protein 1 [Trichomycterus rosablanca]|uniref:transmembrane channel-like protein 1 n=1 Tax=Trichomycterus rosablanca TaxID=2290929 RepID=UPI002F358FD8
MDVRLLRSKMQRQKLIARENDEDKDVFSLYYVGIDRDIKGQRSMDHKSKDKTSQVDTGRVVTLQNGFKNGISGREEVDGLKDRKNSKNKRNKKQQEAEDIVKEGEDEKKPQTEHEQEEGKKRRKRRNFKENVSECDESSSSEEELEDDEDQFMSGSLNEEMLEKLREIVEEKKRLISTLRAKPWPMHKKLSVLRKSQAFLEKYEGALGGDKARKLYSYKIKMRKKWMKLRRNLHNFRMLCVPWEMKIKNIESHYGSSVASYFLLMRWMYGINVIVFCVNLCLIVFPEVLMGQPYGSIPRKSLSRKELPTAMDLDVLWDVGGYIKYTGLFCGYYNNQRTIGWLKYRMPLAYFLVGLGGIVYSYMVVIQHMAQNTSEGCLGDDTNFDYCWKIFTSWDYLIGNPETADTKFAAISTNIKESIMDEKEPKKDENVHLTRLFRVLANFLIFCVLTGSGYLIYFVVRRSGKFIKDGMDNFGWWERNEVNVVMALLSVFCPMLFEVIGTLENYHPRIGMRWQLGRVFALFLGNMYSFIIAIIDQIRYSRDEEQELRHNITMWEATSHNGTLAGNFTSSQVFKVDPADIPRGPCWETLVGQEFVRMLITDSLTLYGVVLVNDFVRAVFVRVFNHCWCWDLEYSFPCYSEFDVSGNVLNLIFNQGMIWMGSFYVPGLPGLNLIRLQISMYLQSWSVMCCNIPQSNFFKISRSNNLYMAMLLAILFLSTVPTIFTIVSMQPSVDCGPFSGKGHIYDVIPEMIQADFPVWFAKVFSHISNPGLVLSVLLLIMLTVYYLQATSKSYRQANSELKKKLRAQVQETRMKTRLVAKKTAEFLDQAKSNGEIQHERQINDCAAENGMENGRQNFHHVRPAQGHRTGRRLAFADTEGPPHTRPPAPQSSHVHGPVPGTPAS